MKRILHHPTVKKHGPQVVKFLVSGVCGATLDLSSQWIFVELLVIPELVAFVLSASIGAITVFFLNKFFTFKNYESTGSQFFKFAIVYAPAIVLNFILSSFFFWLGAPHQIAKALAIGIGAVLNYLFSHFFIFRKKKTEPEEPIVI